MQSEHHNIGDIIVMKPRAWVWPGIDVSHIPGSFLSRDQKVCIFLGTGVMSTPNSSFYFFLYGDQICHCDSNGFYQTTP